MIFQGRGPCLAGECCFNSNNSILIVIIITYLSVANRYRFMREEGTDECTQGE